MRRKTTPRLKPILRKVLCNLMIIKYAVITTLCNSCFFAGEYSSICEISYTSAEIDAEEIIDSLKKLEPDLGQLNQTLYTYDLSGTGYNSVNLFLLSENVRYVLGIESYQVLINHKLRVLNFGKEGEVLKKIDTISRSERKILQNIITEILAPKLIEYFPKINFETECK